MIKKEKDVLKLLEEAQEFFGPCWCKESIGFRCPQCYWIERYEKLVISLRLPPNVDKT